MESCWCLVVKTHGYCICHLANNFRKLIKRVQLLGILWSIAYTTNASDLMLSLEKVINSSTIDGINNIVALHIGLHVSFSGKGAIRNAWLLEARHVPILGMVELVNHKLMLCFYERSAYRETSRINLG